DLNLELNLDKTEIYHSPTDFLQHTEPDPIIDQISKDFDSLINPLWILNDTLRTSFINALDNDEHWWHLVRIYSDCLAAIGIFVNLKLLSRRIYRYLFNGKRRTRDLKTLSELSFPQLPVNSEQEFILEWGRLFMHDNPEWVQQRNNHKEQIESNFKFVWDELNTNTSLAAHDSKRLETQLRFFIGNFLIFELTLLFHLLPEIFLFP